MEAMLRDLSIPEDPSSTADSPGTSNTEAGNDKTREAFRAAWEEMLVKSMDDALSGVPDGTKSNAAGDSEDAFQKSLREATERLHRSDTELQVTTGLMWRRTLVKLKSSSRRQIRKQATMTWLPCLNQETMVNCKSFLRA
jgi:hypothetical protein